MAFRMCSLEPQTFFLSIYELYSSHILELQPNQPSLPPLSASQVWEPQVKIHYFCSPTEQVTHLLSPLWFFIHLPFWMKKARGLNINTFQIETIIEYYESTAKTDPVQRKTKGLDFTVSWFLNSPATHLKAELRACGWVCLSKPGFVEMTRCLLR